MSTLNDVARLAGVSKTLVSRVINNQSGVSPQNRKKIADAIRQLDYRPNALARSLVQRSTKTIGVVMDTICEPFFFPLVESLESAASASDYNLVFSSAQNQLSNKQRAIEYYLEGRADGIILYGSRFDDREIIEFLAKTSYPFVVIENTFPALDINNIYLDNEYGAKLAVEHLLACGCKRIYHVRGDQRYHVSKDREFGFIKAMQAHGFSVDSRTLIPGDFSVEGSYQVMLKFIRETPWEQMPDGLFCASDKTAYGVMRALLETGFKIPKDMMIVGFDDEHTKSHLKNPGLTTLSQPLLEMGKAAFDLLLKKIDTPDEKNQRIVFYPELKIRGTTSLKV